MLNNIVKNVTLTGNSVVTVTEEDVSRNVTIKGFECKINSENPAKPIEFSNFFISEEAKGLYMEHKDEVRKDIADFEDTAFELQKKMIAEKQAGAE